MNTNRLGCIIGVVFVLSWALMAYSIISNGDELEEMKLVATCEPEVAPYKQRELRKAMRSYNSDQWDRHSQILSIFDNVAYISCESGQNRLFMISDTKIRENIQFAEYENPIDFKNSQHLLAVWQSKATKKYTNLALYQPPLNPILYTLPKPSAVKIIVLEFDFLSQTLYEYAFAKIKRQFRKYKDAHFEEFKLKLHSGQGKDAENRRAMIFGDASAQTQSDTSVPYLLKEQGFRTIYGSVDSTEMDSLDWDDRIGDVFQLSTQLKVTDTWYSGKSKNEWIISEMAQYATIQQNLIIYATLSAHLGLTEGVRVIFDLLATLSQSKAEYFIVITGNSTEKRGTLPALNIITNMGYSNPYLKRNLKINKNRLTTKIDLYSTFLDIANLPHGSTAGISLISERVPLDRDCDVAGVSPLAWNCNVFWPINRVPGNALTKLVESINVGQPEYWQDIKIGEIKTSEYSDISSDKGLYRVIFTPTSDNTVQFSSFIEVSYLSTINTQTRQEEMPIIILDLTMSTPNDVCTKFQSYDENFSELPTWLCYPFTKSNVDYFYKPKYQNMIDLVMKGLTKVGRRDTDKCDVICSKIGLTANSLGEHFVSKFECACE